MVGSHSCARSPSTCVRQHEQTLAGRWGLGSELSISPWSWPSRTEGLRRKGLARPPQRVTTVADRAAGQPEVVGEGVAEQPARGVGAGLTDRHPHRSAPTEMPATPGVMAPVLRLPLPVGRPDHDGETHGQSGGPGDTAGQSQNRRGGPNGGQLIEVDSSQPDGARVPGAALQVEQPCSRRTGQLGDKLTGQVMNHVVLEPDPPPGLDQGVLARAGEPPELDHRAHRVHRGARSTAQLLSQIVGVAQLVRLLLGPTVGPRQERGQWPEQPPASPATWRSCPRRLSSRALAGWRRSQESDRSFDTVSYGRKCRRVTIAARVKPVLDLQGLQFRDLNGNGVLDPYEDWRLSAAERAADLVSRTTPEEKIGLMVICSRTMGISQPDPELTSHGGALDEQYKDVHNDPHNTSGLPMEGTTQQIAELHMRHFIMRETPRGSDHRDLDARDERSGGRLTDRPRSCPLRGRFRTNSIA